MKIAKGNFVSVRAEARKGECPIVYRVTDVQHPWYELESLKGERKTYVVSLIKFYSKGW